MFVCLFLGGKVGERMLRIIVCTFVASCVSECFLGNKINWFDSVGCAQPGHYFKLLKWSK